MKVDLSRWCFLASLASVGMSILTWVTVGDADPAHAERFAIFIGLWAPTLMGLSNYYKEQNMGGNLGEFLKVLTIVVTWSTCILLSRHYMLSFDEREELEEEEEGERSKCQNFYRLLLYLFL